jgi:hypothetical protein
MFHRLMAQCALNSNSIGRWRVFPYTSWDGVIQIGVLYAVLYAQSASGNLFFQAVCWYLLMQTDKIHKHTDIVVAFIQEYSRVLYLSTGKHG